MQEKYSREDRTLVGIVLTDDDEAAATVVALRRYRKETEADAITADPDVRDLLPERLDEISDLARRVDAGEREITEYVEISDIAAALTHLVSDYETALTSTRLYDEMMADVPNRAEFLVYVAAARRMLSPPEDHNIVLV